MNQTDDGQQPDQIISFTITDQMKKAGISQFFLEKDNLIIKFEKGGMRCYPFTPKNLSISEIVKKIRQKHKHEPNYAELQLALQDIENQLIERRADIFRCSADQGSQNIDFDSTMLDKIIDLREQHKRTLFTYALWQEKVKKYYHALQLVTLKNFPEVWPLLEFCLAVKSILNIEGCNLPFMGIILAIPSSMKTLVIQLFRKYFRSLYSDNFTPNAFESHNAALNELQLRQIDLLPKLNN